MTSATAQNYQPELDPRELRRAFGSYVTGITIITTWGDDGSPRGMTANSFTSVSLDPPLLLVCVGKSASSYPAFRKATVFGVNLLHEGQKDISSLFASKVTDKFAGVGHGPVHTGAPILKDCLTWFDCTVHERIDAGDHMILIGRIHAFETRPAMPLGFYSGRYMSVDPTLRQGGSPSHTMLVGYLIEHEGKVLLREDGEGRLMLPVARHRRAGAVLQLDDSRTLALRPEETFLYSVFDVGEREPGYIIYRTRLAASGEAETQLPPGYRFFGPLDLPWDRLPLTEIRGMLRRYLAERREGRFSVYIDSSDGGRLAMIDGSSRPWRAPDFVAESIAETEGTPTS
ncbi:flavin reductase family protein [Rhodoligotrophos defluvii]|uniref:flavin reductase family protein n=1 Tax=Rhodoligotrophos defluvii TaxID=2561934 RepID=UPI0010C9AAA4|nr:flavin reductase family protein [Rhodoligotrophos defluvii]